MDFYFSESRYIFDNSAIAHNIFDFIKHEDYNDEGFSNDIAILMILDAFEFGIYVNKGTLTDSLDWMDESVNVIAAGWGETKVRMIYNQTYPLENANKSDAFNILFLVALGSLHMGPGLRRYLFFCLHSKKLTFYSIKHTFYTKMQYFLSCRR